MEDVYMKAAVLYWSAGGNTEKVALVIQDTLASAGVDTVVARTDDAGGLDWFDYDLVCVGAPSYRWHPPDPVDAFLRRMFDEYRRLGRVQVGAPQIPGKYALVFCTYCGQHTGIREATPAGLYMGQFFEHLGFNVLDELYVVGQYHGKEAANTLGRLGDVRGRPNTQDLEQVRQDVAQLLRTMTG
jgi:flavorubredoxin